MATASLFATGLALAMVGSSLTWAHDKDSIAARLQVLEDQIAIEQLVTSRYTRTPSSSY